MNISDYQRNTRSENPYGRACTLGVDYSANQKEFDDFIRENVYFGYLYNYNAFISDTIQYWYDKRMMQNDNLCFADAQARVRDELAVKYHRFLEQKAIQQTLNEASQETGFNLGNV
jgi:hypothetical protein